MTAVPEVFFSVVTLGLSRERDAMQRICLSESRSCLFPVGSQLSLDSHTDTWATWENLQPPLIQEELLSVKLRGF